MSKFNYSKEDFFTFVKKYYLSGKVEAAVIESKDDTLSTIFRNDSGDLRGFIQLQNFGLEDCEVGCYDTSQLISMSPVVDSKIDIKLLYNDARTHIAQVIMKDAKNNEASYSASELQIIGKDGVKSKVKQYDVIVKLNNEIILRILTNNTAITKNNAITFANKNGKLHVICGHSSVNSNTAKSELEPDAMSSEFIEMSFPADYIVAILNENSSKFEEATLEISLRGVMRLYFKNSQELSSEYWLVKLAD